MIAILMKKETKSRKVKKKSEKYRAKRFTKIFMKIRILILFIFYSM